MRDEVDCLRAIREKLGVDSLTSETVSHLLHAVIESSDSLILLAERERARDSLILGRVVFENALTALFIWAVGEVAATRAWQYAHARSYRDLRRSLDIGGHSLVIEWQGDINLAENPELDICIAGDQSDLRMRVRKKAQDESCVIDENGVATIRRVEQ